MKKRRGKGQTMHRAARQCAARLSVLFSLLLILPMLSGCSLKKRLERSFFAMDTYMSLTVYSADESVLHGAEDLVREIEERLSVTKEESEISKINRSGRAEVSSETAELLSKTLKYSESTQGALDPSIYPIVRLWGFTTGTYRVPSDEEIAELLPSVDWTKIHIENTDAGGRISVLEGVMLDLGAVTKGYTGAALRGYLLENGVQSAILDLGGNIQTVGRKPDGSLWRVAVKDPEEEHYLGVLQTEDLAIVTSGAYERYFEEGGRRYGHIMDPKTGRPAETDLLSVTVVHSDGVLCDALSTALFVMGEEKSAAFYRAQHSFECILVTKDGRLLVSEGLESRFQKDDSCPYQMEVIRK